MKSKIITMGILVCFMAAALSGCGTKNDFFGRAIDKANTAKSMEAEATIDMAMKSEVEGESQDVDMKYKMNISAFQEPLKMKMDVNMDLGGTATNIESYMVEHDGEYIQYMNMGELGGWLKQVICKADDMKTAQEKINQLDAAMFMNKEFTYKEQPDEEENGKTYKVYTCEYTEEVLKSLIGSMDSTSLDSLDSYSGLLDEDLLKEIITSMEGLEFTIWIDSEKEELYRVKASMTEVVKKIMQKILEKSDDTSGVSLDVTKMDMDIKYKNYDKAADFELPSEALNAVDMSEAQESVQ